MKKTILGADLKTGEKITLNDKERRSGLYILGVQGRGKSSLLLNLIAQDIEKGYGVIIFDAHDDLIRHLIALMPSERLNKTYLLDLDDTETPYGLNLFACSDPSSELERATVVERVLHVFERLWPEIRGILLEKMLRYITLTFLECPGYSLIDIRRLLWDDDFRADLVSRLTNEDVKAYWLYEYNMMTHGERRTETQALDNRLAAFLSTPFVRNIVCQRQNTLDFYRAIQEQEILLIRLPMAGRQAHVPLIGTILLAHLHAATFAFAKLSWNQRPGYSLYVDEFQHFATSDFAELYKEARKFGGRITIAHQDRQDLTPENRSATLTASTIVAFQPTPADAVELSSVFFDSGERLRPEHIYADPLPRLRLHEHSDIQDFYQRFVLSLQTQEGKQARRSLEVLQDLLYQSVKTQGIHDRLFETYIQQMFELLRLTFTEPKRKQKQIYTKLQQLQQDITTLSSLLTSEQALDDYLISYYWHYISYGYKHSIEWYYQPWLPENFLLADTEFWDKVLGKTPSGSVNLSYKREERLKKTMDALQEESAENDKLHHLDTLEKVLAEVIEQALIKRRYILGEFWKAIANVHRLKSEHSIYSAIQQFHAEAYGHCRSTISEPGDNMLFWQPASSRKKRGIINETTRVDELIAQPLALEAEASREQLLAWLPSEARWGEERPGVMVLATWDIARRIYAELRKIDLFLADETALLKAYYSNVGKYARNHGLWEQLNNERVDENVWQALKKELQRNALLGQINTVEKLMQLRKNLLPKKIALLTEELEAYRAILPNLERNIQEEIATIEQQQVNFCTYVRHILELLIKDPSSLGERRIPKESDVKEKLLNLQKRQALVRISGDINQKPRKYTMQTLDVLQAVKQDESERRLHQIREQTRTKYNRPRSEVEQELRASKELPERGENEEPPSSWYEE